MIIVSFMQDQFRSPANKLRPRRYLTIAPPDTSRHLDLDLVISCCRPREQRGQPKAARLPSANVTVCW